MSPLNPINLFKTLTYSVNSQLVAPSNEFVFAGHGMRPSAPPGQ